MDAIAAHTKLPMELKQAENAARQQAVVECLAGRLSEINKTVIHMNQMIQQNAAMVGQGTAAYRSLTHDTEQLARLTARFQLPKLAA